MKLSKNCTLLFTFYSHCHAKRRLSSAGASQAFFCSTPLLHLLEKILTEPKMTEDFLLFSSFDGELSVESRNVLRGWKCGEEQHEFLRQNALPTEFSSIKWGKQQKFLRQNWLQPTKGGKGLLFFWYDNDKGLEACFSVTRLTFFMTMSSDRVLKIWQSVCYTLNSGEMKKTASLTFNWALVFFIEFKVYLTLNAPV